MNGPEERSSSEDRPAEPGKARVTLTTVALCLVSAATGWFLLKELAILLRPLLLAVFLCYIILPAHHRFMQRVHSIPSLLVMAGVTAGVLYVLAWFIYGSAVELNKDLPLLTQRAQELVQQLQHSLTEHLPSWLADDITGIPKTETPSENRLKDAVTSLLNVAADALTEAIVVGIYLLFLLLEARRFPQRVRNAFPAERADQILGVAGNINEAIGGYLKAKVKASLILAVPITVILLVFGVKFAVLWGVLTFLCNFIPYLGSILACTLPIVLSFLQPELTWQPPVVAVLLITIHLGTAQLIEPSLIGKAVGLSPLVILIALSFWGLCWGLIGMLLAVPLTVLLKIVLENVPATRPFAKLLGDE